MNVKCINCGSTTQVRQDKVIYSENNADVYYSCGCGTRFVKVYEFVAQFKLLDKKVEKIT